MIPDHIDEYGNFIFFLFFENTSCFVGRGVRNRYAVRFLFCGQVDSIRFSDVIIDFKVNIKKTRTVCMVF